MRGDGLAFLGGPQRVPGVLWPEAAPSMSSTSLPRKSFCISYRVPLVLSGGRRCPPMADPPAGGVGGRHFTLRPVISLVPHRRIAADVVPVAFDYVSALYGVSPIAVSPDAIVRASSTRTRAARPLVLVRVGCSAGLLAPVARDSGRWRPGRWLLDRSWASVWACRAAGVIMFHVKRWASLDLACQPQTPACHGARKSA